jgi:glucokinase
MEPILVGDVGGTHTRFALVTASHPPPWPISHRCELWGEYPDFQAMLRAYFDQIGPAIIPATAVIAAAGPVNDGIVNLTNRELQISESDLRQFGFRQTAVINDFAALAFAADVVGPSDLRAIGAPAEGLTGAPISIVGAGTGFGVSCLVRDRGRAIALTTEGGHIGFAPADNQQMAVLSTLEQWFGRVSVEHILSGNGLELLHRTMEGFVGREHHALSAEQISTAASSGDAFCQTTLSLFCSIYGAVAGDIALAHGARGGVLIGGGIAPKIERFLLESPFRDSFERKGRLYPYMKSIPTKLIVNPDATLLGAARAGLELWGAGATPD